MHSLPSTPPAPAPTEHPCAAGCPTGATLQMIIIMQINPGGTRKGSGSCRAAALPGSAPGRALGGAAAAEGGGSGGASQPRHPAGREPPTGNRPFKQRSLCLPGSWRGSGSL